MNTRNLISMGAALAAITTPTLLSAKESKSCERPNILCITCEDISLYLGCYGDKVAKTPNLDRMAQEGILFSDMHTTVGVSAPSRFSLATGMYSSAMGANYMRTSCERREEIPADIEPYNVVLPDEVKLYSEYLREAGYYCTNNNKEDYQLNAPLSAWDDSSSNAHYKNRPEGAPFFAVFNLFVTHESQTWARANQPLAVDPNDIIVPPYFPDNDIVRRDMAVVYSNIAEMDRQFQRLVDELEASGEADNTIIIWYSDNGGPLPRQKRQIYESGTHVPFLIRYPDGKRAGEIDDQLAMFVDIPATILSLAGVKPPKHMHGRAFLGEYAAKKERDYVYAARDRMDEQRDKQGGVRDHRFRYIKNYDTNRSTYMPVGYRLQMPMMRNMVELYEKGELDANASRWFDSPRPAEELYDDIADPHNINNLAGDPQYSDELKRLRKAYARWIDNYNDRWMLSEQESRAIMHPEGDQVTLPQVEIALKRGKIHLTSSNKGASIVYKIDNQKEWQLYTKPLENLAKGSSLQAVATRAGFTNSDPANYNN